MIMKIPNNSSGYFGYGGGDSYDSFESDPEDYSTPPNENEEDIYQGDFSEYMWMENEEEFDQLELERLEQEELMEQCLEAMLEDELEEKTVKDPQTTELCDVLSNCSLQKGAEIADKSTLNPMAAEFVPPAHLVAPTKT